MTVLASTAPSGPVRQTTVTFRVLLGAGGLAALAFFAIAVLPYANYRAEAFGPIPELYWPRRHALLVHIAGGTVALLLGPVTLWLGETRRRLGLHRPLGFAYIGGVAVGTGAAVYLSLTTPVGWIFASGLFGLAVAWTITTGMAFMAIARRAITQHREWMIRSYVKTLAFVFFRAFAGGLESLGVGTPVERASAAAWFCWAVPLLLTEPVLQWRKQARG